MKQAFSRERISQLPDLRIVPALCRATVASRIGKAAIEAIGLAATRRETGTLSTFTGYAMNGGFSGLRQDGTTCVSLVWMWRLPVATAENSRSRRRWGSHRRVVPVRASMGIQAGRSRATGRSPARSGSAPCHGGAGWSGRWHGRRGYGPRRGLAGGAAVRLGQSRLLGVDVVGGGILIVGVRDDEHSVEVHDQLPARVRRLLAGQLPHPLADFGPDRPGRLKGLRPGRGEGIDEAGDRRVGGHRARWRQGGRPSPAPSRGRSSGTGSGRAPDPG